MNTHIKRIIKKVGRSINQLSGSLVIQEKVQLLIFLQKLIEYLMKE